MEELPGQEALFDLTPEQVQQQLDEMAKQARLRRRFNAELVAELAQHGRQINPAVVTATKLDILISMIFDDASKLELDIAFENAMTDVLNANLATVRRQSLMAPHNTKLPTDGKPPIGGGLYIPN